MYYCGIDVAKRSHEAVVVNVRGKIVKPVFKVENNREGFDKLVSELSGYDGELRVGLESTGHYWLPLYDMLSQFRIPVTVINPLQIHAYRKIDLRKRKTDRQDAYWIADFMRFANPDPTSDRTPVFIQLRELSRFRHRLSQQIGDCKRKIICILDRVFPEYEKLFSSVFLQSSRRLLEKAVTADEFAELDLAELAAILSRVSRGRFGQSKAEELQALARRSVGVSFLADAIHVQMGCLLEQITLLEQQQQKVEASLEELMGQLPQYITTIPGVGLVTGAAMLGEIGDANRFESVDKLVAYAGIDPSVYKSGQFEGDRMHMSKRGSPYLRYALWQAATTSLLHNRELKQFYDKKRAEGKPHGVALGAVCRKLLSRIYVVLKEQRPYEIR
jgi:transposase